MKFNEGKSESDALIGLVGANAEAKHHAIDYPTNKTSHAQSITEGDLCGLIIVPMSTKVRTSTVLFYERRANK